MYYNVKKKVREEFLLFFLFLLERFPLVHFHFVNSNKQTNKQTNSSNYQLLPQRSQILGKLIDSFDVTTLKRTQSRVGFAQITCAQKKTTAKSISVSTDLFV